MDSATRIRDSAGRTTVSPCDGTGPSMKACTLNIGNRNDSSWSLRAVLMLEQAGIGPWVLENP